MPKKNRKDKKKVKKGPKKPAINITKELKKYISPKLRGFLVNILLLLFSLSILFAILEIGSRIILKPKFDKWYVGPSYDFDAWRNSHLEVDLSLFRKAELYMYSNRINILGLGDSFAFGSGVYNGEETYLALLEKYLNEASLPVNISNIATPGNNIREIVTSANNYVRDQEPDIVLYSIVLNDLDIDHEVEHILPSINLLPFLEKYLEWSYFYFYVNKKFTSLIQSIFYRSETTQYYEEVFSQSNILEFEYIIQQLKNLSEQNNAELMAVILPLMDDFKDYKFDEYHRKIAVILENNGIKYIDTLPGFSSIENPKDLWVHPYDSHPNETAHKIFAEKINTFLAGHLTANYSEKISRFDEVGEIKTVSTAGIYVEAEGRILFREGRYRESINVMQESLKRQPDNFLLYMWIGRNYMELKNSDLAITNLQKSLELNPNYKNAAKLLANAYFNINDIDQAIKYFEISLQIDPKDADVLHDLSILRLEKGEVSVAENLINQAIEIEPDNAVYLGQLGECKFRLNQFGEAKKLFEEVLKTMPKSTPAKLGLAKVHYAEKDYAIAVDIGLSILENEPGNIIALSVISQSHFEQKQYEETVRYLNIVLEILPDEPTGHLYLSKSYYYLKKYDLAWKELRLVEKIGGIEIEKIYYDLLKAASPEPKINKDSK